MAHEHTVIDELARTREERILLTQIAQKANGEKYGLLHTKFLNMHEASLAEQMLRASGGTGVFWGGYERAERKLLLFLPEWMERVPTEGEDCPLTVLRCTHGKHDALTHRDYLGALMGLGLKREGIGDILVREDGADILVLKEVAPYLLMNFTQAGHGRVRTEETTVSQLILPEETVTSLRGTVASLRLDAVTAALFRLSRTKAADAIRSGKVFVNQRECLRPDEDVRAGDRITLRGTGRGEVADVLGESRKGRIVLELRRYG